jgi:hypothetical protein
MVNEKRGQRKTWSAREQDVVEDGMDAQDMMRDEHEVGNMERGGARCKMPISRARNQGPGSSKQTIVS